jgi:dinuclear metal center YbgI/SA1388 family protein
MVNTGDIYGLLNTIAPFELSEAWDNSGLQAGNLDWPVKKVMIGLDVSVSLMTSARDWGADLVLTHHPLLMQPEKTIDFQRMPGRAIEISACHKISIISAHTNLDKAFDGLNDYFALKIGLSHTKAFHTEDHPSSASFNSMGIGRIGSLESQISLEKLGHQIKKSLNLPYLRVIGDMDLPVTTIAICTGSGGGLLDVFFKSGAEVYITGDIKYHEARQVEACEKGLIDVGHFGSEHMAIELLSEKLRVAAQEAGFPIKIKKYQKEKDPFIIF